MPPASNANQVEASAVRILSTFLITPAPLQSIITLPRFQSYFPSNVRDSPQIPFLYRQLQRIRQKQCEKVQRSIEVEASTGTKKAQTEKRELRKQDRLAAGGEAQPGGVDELFHLAGKGKRVRGQELLRDMETCADYMERELQALEEECAELIAEIESKTGDLSDLIYGKLNGEAEAGLVESLADLEGICQEILDEAKAKRQTQQE